MLHPLIFVFCAASQLAITRASSLASSVEHNREATDFIVLNPANFSKNFHDDLWASENVPFFECSDEDITTAYFYRWQVYKSHVVHHEKQGYVVTEFLPPVSWAGQFNTIAGSAGHHIYEGRWLKNPKVLDDYSSFWFSPRASPRAYTAWLTNAIHARFHVPIGLLDGMERNLQAWRETHFAAEAGCFYQSDTADGGEDSISGGGCRVSINSVMLHAEGVLMQYGELAALAAVQELAGLHQQAAKTKEQAASFRQHILQLLWDSELQFFAGLKVVPPSALESVPGTPPNSRCPGAPEWPLGGRVPVRELLALSTPFFFGLVPLEAGGLAANYSNAWDQLLDKEGFAAEWGPRTAERRHPAYNFSCEHPCTWNGPSWPYETSRLLAALANVLNEELVPQNMSSSVWLRLLAQYARAHTRSKVSEPSDLKGAPVPQHPWIGEVIHPDDGTWIARDYMRRRKEWDWRRGYLYNHSTFCDLIITGLVGLRPRADDIIEVNPLIDASMAYFALEGVQYHNRSLSMIWDSDGSKYGKGSGLRIWIDGDLKAASPTLQKLEFSMPAASST